ncbi:MAG: hypothetical protein WCE21_02150 [Candidatus Babeliales bacterium]
MRITRCCLIFTLFLSTLAHASHRQMAHASQKPKPKMVGRVSSKNHTKAIITLINSNQFSIANEMIIGSAVALSHDQFTRISDAITDKKNDRFLAVIRLLSGSGAAVAGAAAYLLSQQVELFIPQTVTLRTAHDEYPATAQIKYQPSPNPLEMSAMAAFVYGCYNAWEGTKALCEFDSDAYHILKQAVQHHLTLTE